MFRLAVQENHIDASYLGDRTLSLWINPNGEYLHFSTYNVEHNSGDNTNLWQNAPLIEDEYSRWFWVYFGYNYEAQKATAILKSYLGVKTLTWNVNHMLPVYTTWYLAKDPWYAGFSGKIRKFRIAFGKGAYREKNFKDLFTMSTVAVKPTSYEVNNEAVGRNLYF